MLNIKEQKDCWENKRCWKCTSFCCGMLSHPFHKIYLIKLINKKIYTTRLYQTKISNLLTFIFHSTKLFHGSCCCCFFFCHFPPPPPHPRPKLNLLNKWVWHLNPIIWCHSWVEKFCNLKGLSLCLRALHTVTKFDAWKAVALTNDWRKLNIYFLCKPSKVILEKKKVY